MKSTMTIFISLVSLVLVLPLRAAETAKYPTPRFPSYVKPPKSIEDIMPFARAAVRQTGGRTPLGLVEKGTLIGLVTEAVADDTVLQAIVRAYKERGVEVRIIPEYELAGVSREEVLKAIKANKWYTSELGYMEIKPWITQRFADPEVPKKWLKERRPDIYKAMFSRDDEVITPAHKEIFGKLAQRNMGALLDKYLDAHPEIKGVFWRRGGRPNTRKAMGKQGEKLLGNFIFDNHWELMNKAATFPGDVWKLAEERVIESFGWVDQVQVTDPEGTNFTFSLTEKEAEAWGEGAYQQGHLYLYPTQATRGFPYSKVDYPAWSKHWLAPVLIKVNGVFAGTNNHYGAYPRIEVTVKDGLANCLCNGEVLEQAMKVPATGPIGLEGDRGQMEYRRIRIKETP